MRRKSYWITMKKKESYRWPHRRNQKHYSWCQWFHFMIGMSLGCFCPLTRGKGKLTFENTFLTQDKFCVFWPIKHCFELRNRFIYVCNCVSQVFLDEKIPWKMVFVSKEGRGDFLVILDHQLNNLTKLFDTVDNTSPTTANNVSSGFFFFFFSSKKRMNDASFAYSNNKKNQAQACWVFQAHMPSPPKPTCLALFCLCFI